MNSVNRPEQLEIDAMVVSAMQTRLRDNTTATAVVGLRTLGNKASLGFNFQEGRTVGEVIQAEDGSSFEVLALVQSPLSPLEAAKALIEISNGYGFHIQSNYRTQEQNKALLENKMLVPRHHAIGWRAREIAF